MRLESAGFKQTAAAVSGLLGASLVCVIGRLARALASHWHEHSALAIMTMFNM